jgi:hypothetical protein
MCMARVTKSDLPVTERPEKTVFRWRRYRGCLTRQWRRARSGRHKDDPYLTPGTHRIGSTGFHVYRYKKEAERDGWGGSIKVECAHRLDVGFGDGYHSDKPSVETYQWIRLVKPRR